MGRLWSDLGPIKIGFRAKMRRLRLILGKLGFWGESVQNKKKVGYCKRILRRVWKMGVVSTKKTIFGHFSEIFGHLFLGNRPFLLKFLPELNIFYNHWYFLEIEVWSEFRHSPTKIKGSGQHLGWATENDPYLKNGIVFGLGLIAKS